MFHSTLVKTEGSTQMLLYHNFLCHYIIDDQEISEPEKYTTHTIPELIGLYSTEIVCYSSLAFTTESKADRQTHFSLNWKFSWEVTVPPVSSTTKKLVLKKLLIFWVQNPVLIAWMVIAVPFLTCFIYWKLQSECNSRETATMTHMNICFRLRAVM